VQQQPDLSSRLKDFMHKINMDLIGGQIETRAVMPTVLPTVGRRGPGPNLGRQNRGRNHPIFYSNVVRSHRSRGHCVPADTSEDPPHPRLAGTASPAPRQNFVGENHPSFTCQRKRKPGSAGRLRRDSGRPLRCGGFCHHLGQSS